jgi:hypothetical protein
MKDRACSAKLPLEMSKSRYRSIYFIYSATLNQAQDCLKFLQAI